MDTALKPTCIWICEVYQKEGREYQNVMSNFEPQI